ncbi:OLC1v1027014C1 [Oldenlandia corymbosa var. corymbosa]|uniref:OLC1v1027014C1 n=1 Tax=Oldenlandia corymbosa var. corymbosa TaxID=529605 RepID=A0AAV1CBH6_OLDCO|nr:OLC1v1027014C1 [Oldenlandia corymbosa var. corymbosa]
MGGGRKNLMRAAEDKVSTLQSGQSIMQVLDLRGSNQIEVMDAKGEKSLALFPAKFQRSMWIKRGNFVVVDESGREEAAESGSKVGCVVVQVLFHDQVRELQKSPEWPEVFKASNSKQELPPSQTTQVEGDENSSDDDGLPPLEANMNRLRPYQLHSDTESDSESDS